MAKVFSFEAAAKLYDGTLFEHADGTPRSWTDAALWDDRPRARTESVNRPTEARALLNVHLQARALAQVDEYTQTFTAHELRAFTCEKEALQKHPHLTEWARYEWIAERMPGFAHEWTARRVKAVLQDVSEFMRQSEIERLLDIAETERKQDARAWRGKVHEWNAVVREIADEEAADVFAAMAA
jgi:hypothetical protein